MKKLFLMVMAVWAGLAGTAAAQNLLSPAEATVYEGDKLADEGAAFLDKSLSLGRA